MPGWSEFYSGDKLGLRLGPSALPGFFDRTWTALGPAHRGTSGVRPHEAASACARLGRLAEAVAPMQVGWSGESLWRIGKTPPAAAGNLSELTLTLGEVGRSVAFGEQSVAQADRSGDAFMRMSAGPHWPMPCTRRPVEEERGGLPRGRGDAGGAGARVPPALFAAGLSILRLLLSRGEPEDGLGLDRPRRGPGGGARFRQVCREVQERAEKLFWSGVCPVTHSLPSPSTT